MISQKTRYALRSLLYLVEEGKGAPVQLARIADTQQVPRKYLELIMLELKKAGIVTSARGPTGGYRLARPASEISFGDIIRVTDGPIALVPCASVHFYSNCGDCHDEATCAIRRVLAMVRESSAGILEGTSLADAASWESAVSLAEGSIKATS
ncbi:RrF2 family transcriptional regulator [Sphingosinicella rhizophila]|uniref:Rrf2 family transcriptional regulator n=1 Tax=Sphingosinicella rhizophila TaxID=3050082 RepID=A0ABU3Q6B8_9SPHN|nr:Rrf2 family transcriptional regulator [Sphingosinicella sp. GR2756]MDT9598958.1 Rrf2 family transcriptional regulator [Sphingosinicella sp. GR2756]